MKLPDNIERVKDGAGYHYRGYASDGGAVRLHNDGSGWSVRAFATGKYIGRRKTLALMGKLLASATIISDKAVADCLAADYYAARAER
jgi:hypothetical protein